MCAAASVCVNDDFAAGKTGVAVGTADHEFAGRVDVECHVLVDQRGYLLRKFCFYAWQEYAFNIGLDTCQHSLIGLFLCQRFRGGDEFVVLG